MDNFYQLHKIRVSRTRLRCSMNLVELGARSKFLADLKFVEMGCFAEKIRNNSVF